MKTQKKFPLFGGNFSEGEYEVTLIYHRGFEIRFYGGRFVTKRTNKDKKATSPGSENQRQIKRSSPFLPDEMNATFFS
jgi:hypothetical protein